MFTVLTKRSLIEYDNFKLEMTLAFLGALAFLGCLDLGLINYPTGKLIYIHNQHAQKPINVFWRRVPIKICCRIG